VRGDRRPRCAALEKKARRLRSGRRGAGDGRPGCIGVATRRRTRSWLDVFGLAVEQSGDGAARRRRGLRLAHLPAVGIGLRRAPRGLWRQWRLGLPRGGGGGSACGVSGPLPRRRRCSPDLPLHCAAVVPRVGAMVIGRGGPGSGGGASSAGGALAALAPSFGLQPWCALAIVVSPWLWARCDGL